jgi:hypothetical protein
LKLKYLTLNYILPTDDNNDKEIEYLDKFK